MALKEFNNKADWAKAKGDYTNPNTSALKGLTEGETTSFTVKKFAVREVNGNNNGVPFTTQQKIVVCDKGVQIRVPETAVAKLDIGSKISVIVESFAPDPTKPDVKRNYFTFEEVVTSTTATGTKKKVTAKTAEDEEEESED